MSLEDQASPSIGQIRTYRSGEVRSIPQRSYLTPLAIYPEWTNWTSTRSVRSFAVAPDEDVFWLATEGGIIREERRRAIRSLYTSEHGLPGNAATEVALDGTGRLWAAFDEGGIAWYEKERWTLYKWDLPLPDTYTPSPIRRMVARAEGVWAATAYGVYRIDSPTAPPLSIALYPTDGAVDAQALMDDGDTLLVGNAVGLFRLSSGSCKPLASDQLDGCSALARDSQGRVWLAAGATLYRLEGDELAQGTILPTIRHIRAMAGTRRRLWLLTDRGLGLWQEERFHPVNPPATDLLSIVPSDDERYLWVGGQRGFGYVRVPLQDSPGVSDEPIWQLPWLPPSEVASPHLTDCQALAGPDEQDRLWVGTTEGLALVQRDTLLAGALGAAVHAIEITDHQCWLHCEPLGLVKVPYLEEVPVNPGAASPYYPVQQGLPGRPLRITLDEAGTVYCLSSRGLYRREGEGWECRAVGLPGDSRPYYPYALTQGKYGHWWLGTEQGLFVYEPGEGWKRHEPSTTRFAAVRALLAANGMVWVGTDEGLWCFDGQEWDDCAYATGYTRDGVSVLATAPDGLWVATMQCLIHLDPQSRTVSASYRPRDSGLGSQRIRSLLATERELWVATAAGLSRLSFIDQDHPQGG